MFKSQYLVPDDLNALTGEESDLKASLAAPPNWFFRTGHIDHGDHVAHLHKVGMKTHVFFVVHKSAHILYEQYFQHIEFLAYIEFWLLKQVRHCCVRNGSPVFLLCPSTKGRISNDRSFLFSSVLVPVEGWQQWAGIVYRKSHRFRLKVSFLCSLSSRLAKGIMMTDLIAAKWLGPSQVENLPLVRNICLVARKQKSQTNVCIVAGISHNCFLSCLPVTHFTKLRAQEPKIKSRVGGSNQ